MKPRNSKKLVDAKEIHCSAFRLDLVLVFITTTKTEPYAYCMNE